MTARQNLKEARMLLDEQYEKLKQEAARRNSAYDHYGMGNTPENINPELCMVRVLVSEAVAELEDAYFDRKAEDR